VLRSGREKFNQRAVLSRDYTYKSSGMEHTSPRDSLPGLRTSYIPESTGCEWTMLPEWRRQRNRRKRRRKGCIQRRKRETRPQCE